MAKRVVRECPGCLDSYAMQPQQLYHSIECGAKAKRNEKVATWLAGDPINTMCGKTGTAKWIRRYLLEEANHQCQRCGWGETNPHTGSIPLELEHIDGNFENNDRSNLIILCPNCHSLTPTYKGANVKPGRPRAKYYRGS